MRPRWSALLTVDPKYLAFGDGFFVFPTQTLIRATPDTSGQGQTTAFEPGQNLDAYTSFVDTSVMTPAVKRALTITDGIGTDKASNNDPKAVVYMFDDNSFPNIPLIQPRLNSVEEWLITNFNNDAHPMHIHVNDFQVMVIDDPTRGKTGVQPWGLDNVNVPAPIFDDRHVVSTPSSLTMRQEFLEYAGTYVIHCHRLNHEDNGLDGHSSTSSPRCRRTRWRYPDQTASRPRSRYGMPTATGFSRPSRRSRTSRARRRWRWPTSTAT